jgi:hypothetical protein
VSCLSAGDDSDVNELLAQGEISRTWRIIANEDHPHLDILIREPPLVCTCLNG